MQFKNIIFLALVSGSVFATTDIEITGTVDQTLRLPKVQHLYRSSPPKHIKLLKLNLSDKARAAINAKAKSVNSTKNLLKAEKLPAQVQLGMNNVPVLDQGSFGTCATFANTAAIDAALGKGDYVSQTCLLQLGNYLSNNSYGVSGWDGSIGRTVLHYIENFGVISKEQQATVGCGGLTAYPTDESIPDTAMTPEAYHELSEDIQAAGIVWSPLLDVYKAFYESKINSKIVDDIKHSLGQGHRVTIGVILVGLNNGIAGAVGRHNAPYDTWVLTPELIREGILKSNIAGHEMIVTGYDDNATAVDEQGREYKGLFTLRNSWGKEVGDQGEFYVSYDYFRVLALEAQQITTLDPQEEPE